MTKGGDWRLLDQGKFFESVDDAFDHKEGHDSADDKSVRADHYNQGEAQEDGTDAKVKLIYCFGTGNRQFHFFSFLSLRYVLFGLSFLLDTIIMFKRKLPRIASGDREIGSYFISHFQP
ncbi:MAG TPA: hypothetical protein VLH94_03385 [Spirochaetia bacterium]|nr:hypothetical protein [Spirochaetia bacterium]